MPAALLRFSGALERDPAIERWLAERPGELGAIARSWFVQMRSRGADVRELMHDGCPVVCVDEAPFAYVDAFTAHVNVGFFHGAALADPARLLQGTGRFIRHVKIRPGQPVDAAALEALIDAAYRDIGVRSTSTPQEHRAEPRPPRRAGPQRPLPGATPMPATPTSDDVAQFLHRFEELAMKEDFDLLADLIDERAFFRFNDGDFVGRAAIRAAFEKTWRADPTVRKARFYLTDIVVLTTDRSSATATYTYHWEGSQGGREFGIQGRGTRVLVHEDGRFRIVHEHLSRFPPSP
jgi:ketosteroid isomerase-like protein